MQKNILTSFFLLIFTIISSQNVNIPDVNFKNYLLQKSDINTNGNSEIEITEANNYTGTINCSNKNISDLTGIEAFINITTLICGSNNINNLNVKANKSLTTLYCDLNNLTDLDLTQNTSLSILNCGGNQLTNLDLTKNISLTVLHYYSNNVTNLDLSKNSLLRFLSCSSSNLVTLNLKNGNNVALEQLYLNNSASLICIQVDNVANSNENVANGKWHKDATASFNTNCGTVLNASEAERRSNRIYPNPTKSIINFSEISSVNLYSTTGQKLNNWNNVKSIDLTKYAEGTYIIIFKNGDGKEIQKTMVIKN